MKIICLFGQRAGKYEGQYAPELLAAIDGIGNDENPDYMDDQEVKHQNSGDFLFMKRIVLHVPSDIFDKEFYPPKPNALPAEILKDPQ